VVPSRKSPTRDNPSFTLQLGKRNQTLIHITIKTILQKVPNSTQFARHVELCAQSNRQR
jgi:hypothetical protein